MIWGDSDPKVWVEVLNSFSKLDIKTIVGGHGRPKPRQVIELWKNYLTEIISIVTEAKKNKLSLAQLQQQVSFSSLSSLSKNNFGEEIQQAIHINIDDAYDFNWEAEIDNVLASVWNFMGTKRKKAKLVLNNTDIIKNIVMNEENIKSSAELPANFFAPAK